MRTRISFSRGCVVFASIGLNCSRRHVPRHGNPLELDQKSEHAALFSNFFFYQHKRRAASTVTFLAATRYKEEVGHFGFTRLCLAFTFMYFDCSRCHVPWHGNPLELDQQPEHVALLNELQPDKRRRRRAAASAARRSRSRDSARPLRFPQSVSKSYEARSAVGNSEVVASTPDIVVATHRTQSRWYVT